MPAPSLTTPGPQTVAPGATIPLACTFTDPDVATNGGQMQLDVWCQSGTLNTGTIKGATSLKLVGTLPQIQAYLASLTYGAASEAGSDTIGVSVWDQLGRNVQASVGVTVQVATVAAAPAPAIAVAAPVAAPAVSGTGTEIAITFASAQADLGAALMNAQADAVNRGVDIVVEAHGAGNAYTSLTPFKPINGVVVRSRSRTATPSVNVQQGNALPLLDATGSEGGGNDPSGMPSFTYAGFHGIAKGIPNDPAAWDGISRLFKIFYCGRYRFVASADGAFTQHFASKGNWDADEWFHSSGGGYCDGGLAPGAGSTNPDACAAEKRLGYAIGVPAVHDMSDSTISPGNDTENNIRRWLWIESAQTDAVGWLMTASQASPNAVNNSLLPGSKIEALESARPRLIAFDQASFDLGTIWLAGQGDGVRQSWDYKKTGLAVSAAFASLPGACDALMHIENCGTVTGTVEHELIGGNAKWGAVARLVGCADTAGLTWHDRTRGAAQSRLKDPTKPLVQFA